MSELVTYNTGTPTKVGVYACRIEDPQFPDLKKDAFLFWSEASWWYPGSDQRFRGKLYGWVGPLQRRITE